MTDGPHCVCVCVCMKELAIYHEEYPYFIMVSRISYLSPCRGDHLHAFFFHIQADFGYSPASTEDMQHVFLLI